MLDSVVQRRIAPWLDRAGSALARTGVSADTVTLTGFALGLGAGVLVIFDQLAAALIVMALSRLADGLDGAVARATAITDRGGFLDIVLDFVFYGAIPLAFALRDPAAAALPAAVLLFAFYVNGASFLAFAAIAARRGLPDEQFLTKSIHFTAGLAEASETLLVFAAMMLFPANFAVLAYGFAVLCLATAAARIIDAVQRFR